MPIEKSHQEGPAAIAGIQRHMLVDPFHIVVDLERSTGSRLYDANAGRDLLDMYSCFASMPIGFNHPYFEKPEVSAALQRAASVKLANTGLSSPQIADFVATFQRVVGLPDLPRLFLIEGGALAVENAIKAAMDWKVRKNMQAGREEMGTEVIHLSHCFHGRSGYTLSLTNTDPNKIQYYAKFDWPRVSSPAVDFSFFGTDRDAHAAKSEALARAEILQAIADRPHRICAVILEPIQCEGGDRHFRGEWFRILRQICDEHDILLIYDEIQTGMGVTGKRWCFEHFEVLPDLLCFGKKAQVCGVMAGSRLDEVPDNVFRKPGRIASTWGGNFTDLVRATHYLSLYEEEGLIDHARVMGQAMLEQLERLATAQPMMSATRGRGLLLAFDLPDGGLRDKFWKGCFEHGLLVARCGARSIRLRPVMDVRREVLDQVVTMLREEFDRLKDTAG